MQQHTFPGASPASAAGLARPESAVVSLWSVNERLVSAERELRVQFTRIAQLQAQLDVALATAHRAPSVVDVF